MIEYHHSVAIQHVFWEDTLSFATTIVDATCGNGHDTLYLRNHALPSAHIYGIDIQATALENTKNRLEKEACTQPYTLLLANHGELDTLPIPKPYDLVIFNLGYLPKGNHAVMTSSASTLRAIQAALEGLSPRGLITVVAYPGTPEGEQEMEDVNQFLSKIDQKKFHISKWEPINQIHKPPILFLIKGRLYHEKISL